MSQGTHGSPWFEKNISGWLIVLKDNIWLRKKDEEFHGVGGQNASGFLLKLWNLYDRSLLFSAYAAKKYSSRPMSPHLHL